MGDSSPRLACKPHSVGQVTCPGDHLSRLRVSAQLLQPTRDLGPASWGRAIPSDYRYQICDCGLISQSTIYNHQSPILSSLLGLAPGGGCLADRIAAGAGGLLHHLFTLAESGGLFLWPDPTGYPVPGITRRRAHWSADFPRLRQAEPRSPDQPGLSHDNIS